MCFHWHQVKGREREDGGGGGVGGAGRDKRHVHSFSRLRLQHMDAPVGQGAWGSSLAVCPGQTANIWWNASCLPAHQLAAFSFSSLFTCLLEVYTGTHWEISQRSSPVMTGANEDILADSMVTSMVSLIKWPIFRCIDTHSSLSGARCKKQGARLHQYLNCCVL